MVTSNVIFRGLIHYYRVSEIQKYKKDPTKILKTTPPHTTNRDIHKVSFY